MYVQGFVNKAAQSAFLQTPLYQLGQLLSLMSSEVVLDFKSIKENDS
jgi:hypothetical protein